MSELQNIHAVVDTEIILDLIFRICQEGETMAQCKSCMQTPQPSIVAIPALSEHCIPLLEALCSTYDIATQPGFFDSAMLAMEQSTSRFICIRNRALLGQTELDENETRLLIRTIIGQRLGRLLDVMESLNSSLLVILAVAPSQQNEAAPFRTLRSSVKSIITRLRALVKTIDERDAILLA
jgi:hypothetical protein